MIVLLSSGDFGVKFVTLSAKQRGQQGINKAVNDGLNFRWTSIACGQAIIPPVIGANANWPPRISQQCFKNQEKLVGGGSKRSVFIVTLVNVSEPY